MCQSKANGGQRCEHLGEGARVLERLKAQRRSQIRQGHTAAATETERRIKLYKDNPEAVNAAGDDAKFYPRTIPLTPATMKLLKVLQESGCTPYIVGGAVRDSLTGEPLKDVDVEVYGADTDTVVRALQKITPNVDQVGRRFGVIKAAFDGEEFDVSLPRTENKTGSLHTEFDVTVDPNLTLKQASSRRDFTVNALMYDPVLEHVIDYNGGMEDYRTRTLRHVSDAFDEDPLRVLRGVQQAARFNMTLHPDTVTKARTLAGEFKHIAKEPIQDEFRKLFTKSNHPEKGFKVLKDTQWHANLPGLAEADYDTLEQSLTRAGAYARKNALTSQERAVMYSAVAANSIQNDKREEFLSYLTVGNRTKQEADQLLKMPEPKPTAESLRHWTKKAKSGVTFEKWVRVQKIINPDRASELKQMERLSKAAGLWKAPEPDMVTGETLLEEFKGVKTGRWFGESLSTVRAAQYAGEFRTPADGLAWVKANRDSLAPKN